MKILMVSSEAVPLAKSGGLADVVAALGKSLSDKDHNVKTILPLYGFLDKSGMEFYPWSIKISIGGNTEPIRAARTEINGNKFILVDHPLFSRRNGIYGEQGSDPYSDNSFRFSLFNYAIPEICRRLNWYPDIFHCHDWPSGLLPLILKRSRVARFSGTPSIMTIHNLGYQGVFPKHDIHFTNLKAGDINLEAVAGKSGRTTQLNFLAMGLAYSDYLTTVSKTYAEEIQGASFGEGLHTLLHRRKNSLQGIVNGVDYSEWDPETDIYLPYHFSSTRQENKQLLKAELQKLCGLPEDKDIPVIGMVSRLADQKGFRELCGGEDPVLERIVNDFNIQVIIVGTGDSQTEKTLELLASRNPNLSVSIAFSNELAHMVEAGSDFFLMPSRYEPCGLNQIYSLRYGTIPIVRKTGGLADTVEQLSANLQEGTGIVFDIMSGEAIYEAVSSAVDVWSSGQDTLREIRSRGMNKRFSWDKSSDEYIQIYEKVSTLGGSV